MKRKLFLHNKFHVWNLKFIYAFKTHCLKLRTYNLSKSYSFTQQNEGALLHFTIDRALFEDKRINMFFDGSKMTQVKIRQTDFLIMSFGGPVDYVGRKLEDIHAVLLMTDYHFVRHKFNCMRSLRNFMG